MEHILFKTINVRIIIDSLFESQNQFNMRAQYRLNQIIFLHLKFVCAIITLSKKKIFTNDHVWAKKVIFFMIYR